jgi:transposase
VISSPQRSMKFIGIDIGSEKHVVAVMDADGAVLVKPTSFTEDLTGYEKLLGLIGPSDGALVALEATGHYWQNLFATLVASGFAVALLNPLRTRRFAEVDMPRAKTDSVDALSIAKFAVEKRPRPTSLPEAATLELRELVRLRDRYVQDLGDRVRQLHRALDLTFPEFTKLVSGLDSRLATSLLTRCQTAVQFATQPLRQLSRFVYDGRRQVGEELAKQLIQTARVSVGKHHGPAYRRQVEEFCADIATFRGRIGELEDDIHGTLKRHETAMLLTTINGIGETTAARLVAELGDIAKFESADALAAFVGVVPAVSHSGKRTPLHAPIGRLGHARLRAKLWMPTLVAVKRNPWLRAFYERLIARGKLPKVALTAAMRKLLHAIYSVAKNRRPFVPILPQNAPNPSEIV